MDVRGKWLFALSNEESLRRLTSHVPHPDVLRPCTLGDGVELWSQAALEQKVALWAADPPKGDECGLFVPASGAATRMFSVLRGDPEKAKALWANRNQLAFGKEWEESLLKKGGGLDGASTEEVLDALFSMFRNGQFPKGLVPFQVEPGEDGTPKTVSAFQAHVHAWSELFEEPHLWFTVQPSFQKEIDDHLAPLAVQTASKVSFGLQHPQTDTPALSPLGDWVKVEDGSVLKRPGGHGALLPLLEDVSTPLLVIRNIDNAPSPQRRSLRSMWTRAMVAEARKWAAERDDLVQAVKKGEQSASAMAWDWLKAVHAECSDAPDRLLEELQRPLRMVGVVPNEGQPGGGPFWVQVRGEDGSLHVRPQIVETSEFSQDQQAVLAQATHFNPVEIVAALSPGQALSDFVDESRYLVVSKSIQGQPCKVLEHPGLWNGAMSGWITRFVQIPADCFQPVKTVLDLSGRV